MSSYVLLLASEEKLVSAFFSDALDSDNTNSTINIVQDTILADA